MKRIYTFMLTVLMLLGMITGCATGQSGIEEKPEEQVAEPLPPTPEAVEELSFALLVDKPLYDKEIWQEGLASAQLMDLDGDGLEELLALSVSSLGKSDGEYMGSPVGGDIAWLDVTLDVYGYLDGELSKYGEICCGDVGGGEFFVKVFQKEGQAYLGTYCWAGGSGSPQVYTFYAVGNCALVEKNRLVYYEDWVETADGNGSERMAFFLHYSDTLPDNSTSEEFVTYDEFNQILDSFKEEFTIANYGQGKLLFEDLEDNRLMVRLREADAERKAREERERLEEERKNAYKIVINGTELKINLFPKEVGGEILIPAKETFGALGIFLSEHTGEEVFDYNDTEKVLIATTKKDSAALSIFDYDEGFSRFYCKDKRTGESIDGIYTEIDGYGYLSLNAISEKFPVSVDVDKGSKIIHFTSNISMEDRADALDVEKMLAFSLEDAEQFVVSKGYRYYGFDNWSDYYEGGKKWYSLYVIDPSDSSESTSPSTEIGRVAVAHDGTIGQYEYFGMVADIPDYCV